jgi:hypothetical protein
VYATRSCKLFHRRLSAERTLPPTLLLPAGAFTLDLAGFVCQSQAWAIREGLLMDAMAKNRVN